MNRSWLWLLALGAGSALAGEPLATDDASILPKGLCQLEAWHRYEDGGHEGWAVPACSVSDHIELGVGGARYRVEDGSHGLLFLQAKSVFYSDPDERWSAGGVLAAIRDNRRLGQRSGFHEGLALGLLSFNFLDQTLRVHANAGIAYSYGEFTTGVWGTAAEFDFREGWTALAEIYRDAPGRPNVQLGLRYILVTDRVELFISAGDRLDGNGDAWFAKFGVRFQTWKLF